VAHLLHAMLASRASEHGPLEGLGRAFLAEAMPLIETPWMMSAIPDFVFPETRGERPVDLEERLGFAVACAAELDRSARPRHPEVACHQPSREAVDRYRAPRPGRLFIEVWPGASALRWLRPFAEAHGGAH
jgi:hypothetical protein